jgi:hypothetical protein
LRYLAKKVPAETLLKQVVRATKSFRFKLWGNNLTMMSFKAQKAEFLV